MPAQIIDCVQGSEEWFKARLGIPTASEFHTVMARGKDGGASVTRKTYMMKLAGEIITGQPMENYSNDYMERGKSMEGAARDLYSFMFDVAPETVGFIRNGTKGCSPDALLGAEGVLEIKTKAPHLLIEAIEREERNGEFPPEHRAQCQGALWVTEREWLDLVIYYPDMPLFVKKAPRDEAYIAKISAEVSRFNDDLAAMVERVKRYGKERVAA